MFHLAAIGAGRNPRFRGGGGVAIVFPDFALSAIWKPTVRRQRTIVQKRCSRCHSMERIQTGDKTSRQWLRTVRKMQTLAGHEWLSDQDAADILAYLSSRRP